MIEAQKNKKEKEELEEKLKQFIENTEKTFTKEVNTNGCIGGISELYDSKKPHLPKGTINQAWSVAEVLRIILKK
jgi:glycogen debranching enzyme